MIARQPLGRAHLEICSRLDALREARQFVRRVCRHTAAPALSEADVAALELAVNEAASNIITHAYHGRSDGTIQIDADIFPDHVTIHLRHLGDPFEPERVRPPAFDGSRESGFGCYLIAQCVDEVAYYRDEHGRHCIALTKRHHDPSRTRIPSC